MFLVAPEGSLDGFLVPKSSSDARSGFGGVANETWEGKRTKKEMPKPFA